MIPKTIPFSRTIEVRWSDMDAMGHVNNARYFTYLESARMHFFESLGLSLLNEKRHGIALVSVACDYHRQVRYPATLEIATTLARIGTSSFHLAHAFFLQGDPAAVAHARSVVVCVDYAHDKSIPLPEELRAKLESLLMADSGHAAT